MKDEREMVPKAQRGTGRVEILQKRPKIGLRKRPGGDETCRTDLNMIWKD